MVLALIYVLTALAVLIPISKLLGVYEKRMNLSRILSDLSKLGSKLSTLSPEKEKKVRMLRDRYKRLRRRVSLFIMLNLISMWTAIFVALIASRFVLLITASFLRLEPYIASPIDIPLISVEGYLNDTFLLLALILAYYPLHTKWSGLYKLRES